MASTTSSRPRSVGFAGLGAMGFGMASNLLKAGFAVKGFDLNPVALDKFAALGGVPSKTVRDVSYDQETFLVMVATPQQADSLIFNSEGLVESLPKGAILCLFSTLPPSYVVDLKERLVGAGRGDIRLVDCPVSGGFVGAAAGTLTLMIGGDKSVFDELQDVLDAVSAPGRLFRCGPLGAGNTVKMMNQHLAGVHAVAAAETMAFARALGLSSREAHRILMASEAASWMIGDRGISMLNADWSPKSAVTIFTKDLGIVNDAANSLSFPAPIASVALQAFQERAARGHGRDDDASVVCIYEDVTGAVVAEPELSDALSTPPGETISQEESPKVVFVAAKDGVSSVFGDTSGKGSSNFSVVSSDQLDATLSTLPEGSVVGLAGSEKGPAELAAKYPQLRFTDYHVSASADRKTNQILFSAQDTHFSAIIKAALPSHVAPVPVTGQLGSAYSMWLAIRLGSYIHLAAAAECLNLAAAKGVPPQLVYDLVSGAAGASAQFNSEYPFMLSKDFFPKYEAKLGSIGRAMGELNVLKSQFAQRGFPGRMLDAAHQIFKAVNRKGPHPDTSAAVVVNYWN